jgi:hypothetical protein
VCSQQREGAPSTFRPQLHGAHVPAAARALHLPVPSTSRQSHEVFVHFVSPPKYLLLRLQPVKELRREVRNNNIRTRPQDPLGALKRHRLAIEDARFRRSANHSVLAANLIRRHRHVFANLFRVRDDIQVLRSRFHHDHVSALADVARDGAARKTTTAWRELVAASVAESGHGACGVSERTVQAAGEFGGVGHEQDAVGDAGFDEFELDSTDAAVVHV